MPYTEVWVWSSAPLKLSEDSAYLYICVHTEEDAGGTSLLLSIYSLETVTLVLPVSYQAGWQGRSYEIAFSAAYTPCI